MPEQKLVGPTPETEALSKVADALSRTVDRLDLQTPHKIPFHLAVIKTPWNPDGKKTGRARLRRPTFQNGAEVNEVRVSEEEIGLFNKLTPGRFGNERQYVVVVNPTNRAIDFRYPTMTIEQRMALANDHKGRGLVGLLELCIAEAADRKANPEKYHSRDNGFDE